MRHKVNPHTIRVGVIRDWESRWDPNKSFNVTMNSEKVRNLSVFGNIRVFGTEKSDIERIVKTMKKR